MDYASLGFTDPNDPEFLALAAQKKREQDALTHAPLPVSTPTIQTPVPTAPSPLLDVPRPPPMQKPAPPPEADPLKSLKDATTPAPGGPGVDIAKAAQAVGPDVQATRAKPTAKEGAILQDIQATTKEQVADARAAAATEVLKKQEEERLAMAEQQQREAFEKQAEEKRQTANTYLTKQREAVAKAGVTDYWADKSTGSRMLAYVMAGIGHFAATLSGGPNTALQVLNANIDHDFRLKRQRYDEANQGYQNAKENRELVDIEIRNQQAGMLDSMKANRLAVLSKYGVLEAQQAGDEKVRAIEQAKNALLLTNEQSLRSHVTTSNAGQNALKFQTMLASAAAAGPDKGIDKANGEERKADHFTNIGAQSFKQLKQLPAYSAKDLKEIASYDAQMSQELAHTAPEKLAAAFSAFRGTLANRLSPEGRKRLAAETTFINSTLRPETGAAISAGEYTTRALEVRMSKGDNEASARQKDQTMIGYLAGAATQSFRPGYWSRELQAFTGGERPLSPAETAAAMKFVRDNPNDPRTPAVMNELRRRRGIQ